MPGVFERLPVSKCEGTQHERNLGGLAYCLGLSLAGLGTQVRDDLVVAGHDRVFCPYAIGFTAVDVSNINVFTVSGVLRSHDGAIESNLDLIIGSVQSTVVRFCCDQIFHAATRHSVRNQVTDKSTRNARVAVWKLEDIRLFFSFGRSHPHFVCTWEPVNHRLPGGNGLPTSAHHREPRVLKNASY